MPIRFIKRGPAAGGADTDFINLARANGIYVDGSTGALTLGTGSSGTASKKVQTAADAPVVLTASTALTAQTHGGVPVVYNNAAGGTITLPAATGSGAKFQVYIGTTLTSGSFILQVANASDFMRGQASTIGSSGITIAVTANTGTVATESDTITFNRTTTGLGTIGDYIDLVDIATNVWSVDAIYASSGIAATPFSAAV